MMTHRKTQSGFSLTEILLAIGIMASLAIGAFVVYPQVTRSRNVSTVSERVLMIAAAHKEFFGDRAAPADLTRETAISAGFVSEQDLNTPWGTIDYVDISSILGIQLNNIPADACVQLGQRLDTMASAIIINGEVVKDGSNNATVDGIVDACAEAGDGASTFQVI